MIKFILALIVIWVLSIVFQWTVVFYVSFLLMLALSPIIWLKLGE